MILEASILGGQITNLETSDQRKIGNFLSHGIKVTVSMSGNVREQKGLRKFNNWNEVVMGNC